MTALAQMLLPLLGLDSMERTIVTLGWLLLRLWSAWVRVAGMVSLGARCRMRRVIIGGALT